ncbi:MAG: hypothetical protein RLZZ32_2310 [Cyanobacteriota bacterium]
MHADLIETLGKAPRLAHLSPVRALEPEIFIQIASYRDPQLGPTLFDLIAKANAPERLRLGICLQLGPQDHNSCGLPSLPRINDLRGAEMRLDLVDAARSRGVCWARARTQSLWRQEAFTLQIDSHMRFAEGWDGELLESWQRCEDPQAVLSCYPNAFELPDQHDTNQLPLLGAQTFDEQGILRLHGINSFQVPEDLPERPLPSALIAAGMLFGPADLIRAVPYDPQLYFYGEEVSLALRLWSHGFNAYNPDRLLVFHLYKASGGGSVTHWADHADWAEHNQRSIERVQALLYGQGLEEPFGLGATRTLHAWQDWSGIDLQARLISEDALAGRFAAHPAKEV